MTERPRKRPKKGEKAPERKPPVEGPRAVVVNLANAYGGKSSLEDPKDSRTPEERAAVHKLRKLEHLRIYFGPADRVTYVDVRIEGDSIDIMSSFGALKIHPHVSNHVSLSVEER